MASINSGALSGTSGSSVGMKGHVSDPAILRARPMPIRRRKRKSRGMKRKGSMRRRKWR